MILFLTVMFCIINKNDTQKLKQHVFYYSVIPILAYSTIGHLFLSKQVRERQGWSDDPGVVTLQREIGIMELVLFIAACSTTNNPQYVSNIFGAMLVLFGLNHLITTGSDSLNIVIFDIIYGSLLLIIYL